MQHYTTPVTTPKPAISSREDAIADGQLIDVLELDGHGQLPLPSALSSDLLDRVEQIAFSDRSSQTPESRLAEILRGAKAALRRAEDHFAANFPRALLHGFVVDFSARIRSRSDEPRYGFVRMHCGPDETGEVVLTLGLPSEI